MSQHPLAPTFHALERRFGKLAFPNLIRIIAIFQFGVLVLSTIDPSYLLQLQFDRALILKGEVWRLFSFMFVPFGGIGFTGIGTIIFGIIYMLFTWMLGDGLERAWDSFGVNLYIFVTWILFILGGFVMPMPGFYSMVLFSSILFAFAALYPDHTILAMLVIPIKIKWLAFVDLAFVLLIVIQIGVIGGFITSIFFAPFLAVFAPGFLFWLKNREKVAERRSRFEKSKLAEGEAFHNCAECGATENTDAELAFFVEDDGEEYCENCLKAREEKATSQ